MLSAMPIVRGLGPRDDPIDIDVVENVAPEPVRLPRLSALFIGLLLLEPLGGKTVAGLCLPVGRAVAYNNIITSGQFPKSK